MNGRSIVRASAIVLVLLGFAPAAQAQSGQIRPGPAGAPTGALREQVWWVPMTLPREPGKTVHLETTVYRPQGPGPFPLVIMSHGSPRDPKERRSDPRYRYVDQSRWFVGKGYAVAIPMRRGYAGSQGDFAEGYGPCNKPDYATAGLSTANDIAAAVQYFSRQEFVDRQHIVLLGHSAGGWGSLAAGSRNLPGVIGIINFAGGRGSEGPNDVCTEPALIDAVGKFGATRTPSLWLYAQNDLFFGPELSHRMFETYKAAAAPALYVLLRPYGRDGHATFSTWEASGNWIPAVTKFLAALPRH